jgi:hypothetical protein
MGPRPCRKLTVEECIRFSISSLTRAGLFRVAPGTPCDCIWKDSAEREILRIYFSWCLSGDGRSFLRINGPPYAASKPHSRTDSQTIEIVRTRLSFGFRHWFRCPGLAVGACCGRRAGILYLYLPSNDRRFACRKCHDLTYQSVQRHDARLDRLVELPLAALNHALETGTLKQRLLAVDACTRRFRRMQRKCSAVERISYIW